MAPFEGTGFASPPTLVANTVHGVPRVGGKSLESCGTSGVPIGGESLAVALYLMDSAMVLLERFAKRCAHGVVTPPGFAEYCLGVLDSLRSSQLNVSCLIGERRKSGDNPNGRFEPSPGKTINSPATFRWL